MPILYIMCGVGFSGKSTLAKKISKHTGAVLISQDSMFFEKEKELALDLDDDMQWEMIRKMCLERIGEELKKGNSVVFDDTSLRLEHRNGLRKIAEKAGAKAEVIFLDTPIEIQKQRQERNRETKERHDVKQEYLDQAIAELEIPTKEENVRVFKAGMDADEFVRSLQ